MVEVICLVVLELCLVDVVDLIFLLKFEYYGSFVDFVFLVVEFYFYFGIVVFGVGGNYWLEWDSELEVEFDFEIKL